MFDEFFNPPPSVDEPVPAAAPPPPEVAPQIADDAAPVVDVAPANAVAPTGPSSISIDNDAPSPSESHSNSEAESPLPSNNVDEDDFEFHSDLDFVHMRNLPFFGVPIPDAHSDEPSTSEVIPENVYSAPPTNPPEKTWTKDHPLENIIGQLERPVSTRLQLHEQALFCYYDAFLSEVEPKNYKEALKQACWIEAM